MLNLKDCEHPKLSKTEVCESCPAPFGWTDLALCAYEQLDLMYPDETDIDSIIKCKSICSKCPVRGFCLELGWSEEYGIWGGFVPFERKRLRKIFNVKHKKVQDRRKMIRTIAYRLIQGENNGITSN